MFYYIVLIAMGSLAVYHRTVIKKKIKKYNDLVQHFSYEDPTSYRIVCMYKATRLIVKCYLYDLYNYYTTFRTDRYMFIKVIHGGTTTFLITPVKKGPKHHLEYGYIDHVRQDSIFHAVMGVNKDFNGYPDVLLEFGNHIRYKFYGSEEIILEKEEDSLLKLQQVKKLQAYL
jgi:hypothetical protein